MKKAECGQKILFQKKSRSFRDFYFCWTAEMSLSAFSPAWSFFSIAMRVLTPSTTIWTSSSSENPRRSALEISNIPPSEAVSTPPKHSIRLEILILIKLKQTGRGDFFFDIKLLLQPDLVFESESNGCNFSSLAPPRGGKNFFHFFFKMTSLVGVGVFSQYFRN